ncbi:MAG: phosphatase PAP2 family protein [Bacillus sp. (in: Bacteria)]|nr:phosphatase PAP2 family protein [Bacillus sp. (in: firmicutes)]
MRELEIEILRFFTGLQQPGLDQFAWILTFLGDETFYFIIIPFVYWCVSKAFGIRLLYVFLISVYINAWLKTLFAVTRPVGVEGLNISALYVESAEVGTRFPHDSFPSGHAQGSATLWGFIAYRLNRPRVWIVLGILVALIALARLYTGVHWPSDIIAGVAIAAAIITVYHFVEKKITALPEKGKIALAVLVPLIMVLLFTDPEASVMQAFFWGLGLVFLRKTICRNGNSSILAEADCCLCIRGCSYLWFTDWTKGSVP